MYAIILILGLVAGYVLFRFPENINTFNNLSGGVFVCISPIFDNDGAFGGVMR